MVLIFPFEQFLLELNNPPDINTSFKYSKRKNKKRNKLWITNGIATSIRKNKNICYKLHQQKDFERKEILYKVYEVFFQKEQRVLLKNLFEENKKNTYKVCQEIKVLIT